MADSKEHKNWGGARKGAGRHTTGLSKPERLTMRLTLEEKNRIQQDADKLGMTIGEFVIFSIYGKEKD